MNAIGRIACGGGARLALSVVLLASWAAAGEPAPAPAAGAEQIARLIEQLGDTTFAAREAAEKRLVEIGSAEVVRQARHAQQSADPEVRERAGKVLSALADRIAEWAAEQAGRRIRWTCSLADGVDWPAVADANTVCFLSRKGAVVALRAADGEERWRRAGTDLAVAGGRIYVVDAQCEILAMDLPTGRPVPGFRAAASGVAYLAAAGDGVYVSTGLAELGPGGEPNRPGGMKAGSLLWALDGRTGKALWRRELPDVLPQAPAIADGRVLAVADGKLLAFDAATGKPLWEYTHNVEHRAPLGLLAAGGGLVCVAAPNPVVALDPATGKARWARPVSAIIINERSAGPAVELADGSVYLRQLGRFEALVADSGGLRWKHQPELKEPAGRQIIRANGGVIVLGGGARVQIRGAGGGAGGVMVFSSTDGAVGGELSPPAVAGGAMYFTSPEGLHAVDCRDGKGLWKLCRKGLLPLRPVVAGGKLYFASRLEPDKDGRSARQPPGAEDAAGPAVLHALELPTDGK